MELKAERKRWACLADLNRRIPEMPREVGQTSDTGFRQDFDPLDFYHSEGRNPDRDDLRGEQTNSAYDENGSIRGNRRQIEEAATIDNPIAPDRPYSNSQQQQLRAMEKLGRQLRKEIQAGDKIPDKENNRRLGQKQIEAREPLKEANERAKELKKQLQPKRSGIR
jgi:hypothetical protein